MKVVADSHALVWLLQDSARLSTDARQVLETAAAGEGFVVSVATLVDLWYVAQTTHAITSRELTDLRSLLLHTQTIELRPIDLVVVDEASLIGRTLLPDPWDRFIVATARVLRVPLVTRDGAIQRSALVETIW